MTDCRGEQTIFHAWLSQSMVTDYYVPGVHTFNSLIKIYMHSATDRCAMVFTSKSLMH